MTSSSSSSSTSLVFTVQRREPELVAPAKPTPHELKYLSDIDDQDGLRFQIPVVLFYRNVPEMRGQDPVKVIRKAIAEALVFYYPFAGRLREGSGRKLMVECTGEGIVFIEADANVRLEQFDDTLQRPYVSLEELLYDAPGSGAILGCPLLLIQVTRLMCGGFIFALRLNHNMSDAIGLAQFMSAVGEIARGARTPSVFPVWERELLNARDPPRMTFLHPEYDDVPDTNGILTPLDDDMALRSFFFGPTEVAAIRKHLPLHLRTSSTRFEVLTACLWRCRTIAIQPNPDEDIRLICIVNARAKFQPPLPVGYYGNAVGYPMAISSAEKLCQNPLGYALELVRKAKANVNEEYMKSLADMMVMKERRPQLRLTGAYMISDLTSIRFEEVDFGWGKALYIGNIKVGLEVSYYIPFTNHKGEDGIVVPVCLPRATMERFVMEIQSIIKEPPHPVVEDQFDNTKATLIKSTM